MDIKPHASESTTQTHASEVTNSSAHQTIDKKKPRSRIIRVYEPGDSNIRWSIAPH